MTDEEDVEVWIKQGRSLQPDLLLKGSSYRCDSGPLAEEYRGVEIIRVLYKAFDPRVQLPSACAVGRRGRSL